MPGEDQERFEDYLELEHYIEELQAGHVAHPPGELTPDQARIYRMAALFRSATPEAAELRPEFVEQLRAHLEEEIQHPASTASLSSSSSSEKTQPLPLPPARKEETRKVPPQRRPIQVSRRALLTGGAAVAASLAIGAGIERMVDHTGNAQSQQATGPDKTGTETPSSYSGVLPGDTWQFVTTLAVLGENAIRFATDTIVGYVIQVDEGVDKGKVIGLSASCTHMGCIVQWQSSDRKFHCPCHGGLFSEYGMVDENSQVRYIYPLPRLETKVENGNVYVKVPASHTCGK